ncbi:MAG: hypothetical protein ACE5JV_01295 [Nitrososphaerales archaeon]
MKEQELSYEQIVRIIELCRAVEKEGFDPFKVDIRSSLRTLKRYLPRWKEADELLLDMEAIRRLAELIRLQGEWIKHRVSTLYVDPLLVELKLKMLPEEKLAGILLQSLHPIVSLNQVSPAKLTQALDYWNRLAPLKERMAKLLAETSLELDTISHDDLVGMEVLSEKEFNDNMQGLWQELLERSKSHADGKVPYWEFIAGEDESYEDSVRRAYLTTFLVSEGYARMEIDPLEESIHLLANERQQEPPREALPRSIVVSFDSGSWQELAKKREEE